MCIVHLHLYCAFAVNISQCFVSNAKHRAQKYLNSRIPFGKVLSDVVCPGHLNTPCSGFQRQKEIIHGCFLCNKPVLAVVIIVLITLNHVSLILFIMLLKCLLGKWAEKLVAYLTGKSTCTGLLGKVFFLPWKHIIKFLVRGGCSSDFSQLSQEVY